MTAPAGAGIGSFAVELGERERRAEDIPGFAERWAAESPGADFARMGCRTFRTMDRPVEEAIAACTRRTLADHGTDPAAVDRVVLATTDTGLGLLGPGGALRVLEAAGLTTAVPTLISWQQCCSSLTALGHGWDLLAHGARHVLVVAFDRWPDDGARVRSFALFSDAVTSCLLSRDGGPLRLAATAVGVDPDGLRGRDTFATRQQVAKATLATALDAAPAALDDVVAVFPTNLYTPLAVFNASATGLPRGKLHFADTLATVAHCGNCDWMLNLVDHQRSVGLRPGGTYLAQASAPGFAASGVLVAGDDAGGPR